MKQMLRALLDWLLCRDSSKSKRSTDWPGKEEGAGQPGQVVITDGCGNIVFDSWNTEAIRAKKSFTDSPYQGPKRPGVTVDHRVEFQARQDYELLKSKFNPASDLATISRNRYDGLLKLAFIDEEVNTWLQSQQFIFLDAAANIGIVRC